MLPNPRGQEDARDPRLPLMQQRRRRRRSTEKRLNVLTFHWYCLPPLPLPPFPPSSHPSIGTFMPFLYFPFGPSSIRPPCIHANIDLRDNAPLHTTTLPFLPLLSSSLPFPVSEACKRPGRPWPGIVGEAAVDPPPCHRPRQPGEAAQRLHRLEPVRQDHRKETNPP